jgi:redox-sensing transcriptional repressor
MSISVTGSPSRGYRVHDLVRSIERELDSPEAQFVVLIGVGCLGQALLSYVQGRRSKLVICAAFDIDPQKVDRVFGGCRAREMSELEPVLVEHDIRTAVLTVPVSAAQEVADRLARAGICGILNYAPVRLRVPDGVYVEDLDMTMALERVAYFARQRSAAGGDAR